MTADRNTNRGIPITEPAPQLPWWREPMQFFVALFTWGLGINIVYTLFWWFSWLILSSFLAEDNAWISAICCAFPLLVVFSLTVYLAIGFWRNHQEPIAAGMITGSILPMLFYVGLCILAVLFGWMYIFLKEVGT